jgi:hypothetical protein
VAVVAAATVALKAQVELAVAVLVALQERLIQVAVAVAAHQ